VVQRYGPDVVGGSESLSRMLAERMVARASVTVLTTCTRDPARWANDFPAGTSVINGVRVLRFPTIIPRLGAGMRIARPWLAAPVVGPLVEQAYVRCRGPYTPSLVRHLARVREQHDLFVFFAYDYYPSLVGIHAVSARAIAVPASHDDGYYHRPLVGRMLAAARRIIALTPEEEALVRRRLAPRSVDVRVAACGIDAPDPASLGRAAEAPDGPYILTLGRHKPGTEHVPALARAFRERHGSATFLDDHGRAFRGDQLTWLLVGDAGHDRLRGDGVASRPAVTERARWELLAGSLAHINPSRFESLSLTLLEAWALGRPTLANAESAVMVGQTARSGGGATYARPEEFADNLAALLRAPDRRRQQGDSARAYCAATYRWDTVLQTYFDTIEDLASRRFWSPGWRD
jgi:glycosyltransferase involved in cell wall biosynthesis